MQFHEIISRWPGGTHEKQIYNISETRQRLQRLQMSATCNEAYLLASSRFDGCSFLRTPILNPQDENDEQYNTFHGQTYALLDSAIGVWKGRFPRLQTIFKNHEGRKTNNVYYRYVLFISVSDCIQSIITATAVLHNIAIQHEMYIQRSADSPLPVDATKISN